MKIILPEIVKTGIYNSQVASKNKIASKSRKTEMFEIEIPIANGGISYIDSEEIPIEPNMVICVKPGQIRHTKFPFKCYYIHMNLTSGDLYDALISIPNCIKTSKYEEYYELFKKMYMYYNTDSKNDEIILHSIILKLIYTLISDSSMQPHKKRIKNRNYETIEKTINYIKENLESNLSLEAIASYAGFSASYFHNFFKDFMGQTLHEYVEEQRIKKAVDMLVTTDYTLTQIAYECGFSSQSYFSYAFKKKMNLSPREYAKEIFKRYEAQH